jgi:ubiquinone/menaquinone biosynthesis C-methylase UbiE
MNTLTEDRKIKEVMHSDYRRSIVKGYEYLTDTSSGADWESLITDKHAYEQHFANMKFYSIARTSFAYRDGCLLEGIKGLTVLDYCCGNGEIAVEMARQGARQVYGIDLSPVAIENAQKLATRAGVSNRCTFEVMDAEHMTFPDGLFDIVHEYGALHHLDLKAAYKELARVIKPDGRLVCTEALRHNPFIHWYRKCTLHLRTQWEYEHILGVPEINLGKAWFENLHIRFFHLASLVAVPFRKKSIFAKLLSLLERSDEFLLRMPLIQRWAWVAVVVFSYPIISKSLHEKQVFES